MTIVQIYKKLLVTYGPQQWWPANSKFEVMVGAVLTQNTAWINVEHAIGNLKKAKVLSPETIVAAPAAQLAAWLKPSGYFNVKAKRLKALCQWLIQQGGVRGLSKMPTPALREALLGVHGVGPETADAILLYALGRPSFVIDTYARRIFQRLGLIKGTEDYETLRRLFESSLDSDAALFNQYHALIVVHGKEACRKKPLCANCCFAARCSTAVKNS